MSTSYLAAELWPGRVFSFLFPLQLPEAEREAARCRSPRASWERALVELLQWGWAKAARLLQEPKGGCALVAVSRRAAVEQENCCGAG